MPKTEVLGYSSNDLSSIYSLIMNTEIVKQRLVMLIDSKSQNEEKINELNAQAKILRKRLQIETN